MTDDKLAIEEVGRLKVRNDQKLYFLSIFCVCNDIKLSTIQSSGSYVTGMESSL